MTVFEKITESPEVLGKFLACLPVIEGPWDDRFHDQFCSGCAVKNCDACGIVLSAKRTSTTQEEYTLANEKKVWEYARKAGYQPLEGRCIIVQPAPDNLSEKIVSFLKGIVECSSCVLQMCEHELILLPFDPVWTSLRKDVSLVLPYGDIQSVELADDLLDTVITIRTGADTIRLTTQQKALSDWRTSGLHATQFSGKYKNWHKENLDGTLKALTGLCKLST